MLGFELKCECGKAFPSFGNMFTSKDRTPHVGSFSSANWGDHRVVADGRSCDPKDSGRDATRTRSTIVSTANALHCCWKVVGRQRPTDPGRNGAACQTDPGRTTAACQSCSWLSRWPNPTAQQIKTSSNSAYTVTDCRLRCFCQAAACLLALRASCEQLINEPRTEWQSWVQSLSPLRLDEVHTGRPPYCAPVAAEPLQQQTDAEPSSEPSTGVATGLLESESPQAIEESQQRGLETRANKVKECQSRMLHLALSGKMTESQESRKDPMLRNIEEGLTEECRKNTKGFFSGFL